MSTTDAVSSATSSATSTTATSSTSSLISKDAFLNILMTQLKYQDPMNPTDTNQFLSQLASITEVESLENISTTLDSINLTVSAGNINQWVGLIGKTVTVDSGDTLSYGDSVTITPASTYDKVVLNLTDSTTGETVQKTYTSGDSLAYTNESSDTMKISSVYAYSGSTSVSCSTTVYRLVQGVQTSDSGIVAVFGNGDTDPVSSITKIY